MYRFAFGGFFLALILSSFVALQDLPEFPSVNSTVVSSHSKQKQPTRTADLPEGIERNILSDTAMGEIYARGLTEELTRLLTSAILMNADVELTPQHQRILDVLSDVDLLTADVQVRDVQFDENRRLQVDAILLKNLRPAGASIEESFGTIGIGNIRFDLSVNLRTKN